MGKRLKIHLDPDTLASKYIALLEADLKLERERLKTARADVEFYRGKCEKLEFAVLESSSAAPAASFVRRSEPPKRPSIGSVKLENAMKPMFHELRRKWDALTEEQQNKVLETGQWEVAQETAAK
jgi:hypothetical protein